MTNTPRRLSLETLLSQIKVLERKVQLLSTPISKGQEALDLVNTIGGGTTPVLGGVEYYLGQSTATTNVNQATSTSWEASTNGTFEDPAFGEVDSGTKLFNFAQSGFYLVGIKIGVESRGTAGCIVEAYPRVNGVNKRPICVTSTTATTSGYPSQGFGTQVIEFAAGDTLTAATQQVGRAGTVFSYQPSSIPMSRLSILFLRGS